MLIFLCQGGESTITVNAPAGSQITASGGGESWSGSIPSGASSVSFNVHTIATWSLTCTSGSLYRETTIPIISFGQSESWTVSFAYIKVHTHPGATIRATKTGFDLGPYPADSNGNYDIPIPAEAIDSTAWTVRATDADAPAVIEDASAVTSSSTSAPDVYPLYRIPIIRVSWSGGSATSYGNGMDNSYAKVTGTNSWKMWVKASCTVTFLWMKTKVHFWGIGKGGDGSAAFSEWHGPYGGGSGGGGGQVKTVSNATVSVNSGYTVTIGSTTSFGSIMSCNAGENGSQMSGGASGGGSGAGYSGEWINDYTYPASSGGGGDGGNGVYAFSDSSFDGVVYGHGGGGGEHSTQQAGYHSTTPGSGGGGASGSGNYGRTNGNNGIFCLKPGDNI